jgi:glucosamine--fructose-6-phosphate aminotransferase (isomerizing)
LARSGSYRSSSRASGAWNIAATIPPESRSCGNGEGLQIRRLRASCATWKKVIRLKPLDGTYGIGHTRWARTAVPRKKTPTRIAIAPDASSLCTTGLSRTTFLLKRKLIEEGHKFTTETDTEVIAHLVRKYFLKTTNGHRHPLEECVRKDGGQLTGVFALQ